MSEGTNGGRLLVAAALVTGLLAGGGVFVWWMHSHSAPTSGVQALAQKEPQPPVPEPASTPPAVVEKPVRRKRPVVVRPSEHKERHAAESPPEIAPAAPASTPEAPQTAATPAEENKRKAVQENERLNGPTLQEPAAPGDVSEPSSDEHAVTKQPVPVNSAPVTAAKYNGPLSGVATWTGKLEKGQILTVTGGTASVGSLSGAGLPGVPVQITVDQSNLGFTVMPNASNGFRTVAFRSHSKHDRITIHWNVIQ